MKLINGLALTLMGILPVAFAGNESGGGGNAVVCYKGKEIKSAELLDVFEGSNVFGDSHLENESYKKTLDVALKRLDKTAFAMKPGYTNYRSVRDLVKHVEGKKRFISKTAQLKPINDSFEVFLPSDCKIKQAAAFLNEDTILFDQNIWEKLSERDRAGLMLHEAIYWFNRATSSRYDSRRTRRVVSLTLGARWNFEDVNKSVPKSYVLCETFNHLNRPTKPVTAFLIYKERNAHIVQFLFLDGDPVISKKTMQLAGNVPDLTGNSIEQAGYNTINMTKSLFEDKDSITLTMDPKLSPSGEKIPGTTVTMSHSRRTSYPTRNFEKQSFHCRNY